MALLLLTAALPHTGLWQPCTERCVRRDQPGLFFCPFGLFFLLLLFAYPGSQSHAEITQEVVTHRGRAGSITGVRGAPATSTAASELPVSIYTIESASATGVAAKGLSPCPTRSLKSCCRCGVTQKARRGVWVAQGGPIGQWGQGEEEEDGSMDADR